jgi:hypothetical protein
LAINQPEDFPKIDCGREVKGNSKNFSPKKQKG